jgi:hypothetical protein
MVFYIYSGIGGWELQTIWDNMRGGGGIGGWELQTIWDNMRGGGGYVQIKKSCRPIPGQGAEQEG